MSGLLNKRLFILDSTIWGRVCLCVLYVGLLTYVAYVCMYIYVTVNLYNQVICMLPDFFS